MTLNEINQAYDKIGFMNENIIFICALTGVTIMGLTYIIQSLLPLIKIKESIVNKISAVVGLMGLIFFIAFPYHIITTNLDNIENWENKVKTGYIEKLPIEKKEIIDFVVTNSSEDIKNIELFTRRNIETTKVEVIYLENGVKTKSIMEVILKKDKNVEKSYMEYLVLKTNLPENKKSIFKKGNYNATLYIPE